MDCGQPRRSMRLEDTARLSCEIRDVVNRVKGDVADVVDRILGPEPPFPVTNGPRGTCVEAKPGCDPIITEIEDNLRWIAEQADRIDSHIHRL